MKELLASKKFGAAALASGFAFFGFKYDMSVESVGIVVAPLIAYIGAQGLADFKKEAPPGP